MAVPAGSGAGYSPGLKGEAKPVIAASPALSFYGMPGIVDMPTATPMDDATLALTSAFFDGQLRNTLSFQITPRLTGSFRYSRIDGFLPSLGHNSFYDRSFDIQYLMLKEGRYRPAVAIGLRDFGGTGLYSGEYLVATKALTPKLRFSGGIGWGRLGSYGGFRNPLRVLGNGFGTRPTGVLGQGGKLDYNKWFHGNAAFFGGVEWQATPRLSLSAEYSSDAYVTEVGAGLFTHKSPFNFAVKYQAGRNWTLGGYYIYGSKVGVTASYQFNLKHPPAAALKSPAPIPVGPRPDRRISPQTWGTGWLSNEAQISSIRTATAAVLAQDGLALESLDLTGSRAVVRVDNPTYGPGSQAIGRTARILTRTLPASVETFEIIPVVQGIPAARVTLRRSDLERLEFAPDGSREMAARTTLSDAAGGPRPTLAQGRYPRLSWGVAPYIALGLFDPDSPVRADLGAELSGRFSIAPGLALTGAVRQRLVGNLDSSTRASDSVLTHVRSDYNLYDKASGPVIDHLVAERFFRPGRNLFGRVSAGYLEPMFAGVSGEVLWKPVDSRLALGFEVNYARQRDFDQQFSLQDYDVVSGHASGYYSFANGFQGQLDVGRYLAGDWGATVSLDREFDNGVKIGAFFTLTNVSAAQFGEGSFDKGIRISIPLRWSLGKPSRKASDTVIRPTTRDGGARLRVPDRLYGMVRDYQDPKLDNQSGMFWK